MPAIEQRNRAPASLALNNLRGLVILIVIAFHSAIAYLASSPDTAFAFDLSPYKWRAFPIIDSHRWIGFDLFCAWQDVYLMALMFFLSALFTWPSLTRKGSSFFLRDRVLRLGVPFVLALVVIMPIALYPVYRMSATDPGLTAYARHYLALPFWPNGPMWFIWQLLALTFLAAALHRLAPGLVAALSRFASSATIHPGRFFAGLVAASALAYVPMALIFTPWSWNEHGLVALQYSHALLYLVYYLAGLGVGAYGLERGLLQAGGMLARNWRYWCAASFLSVMLWMGLTALIMNYRFAAPLPLRLASDTSYAIACGCGCFFVMAASLRFLTRPSRMLDSLAANSFSMYLFHYIFVVWLQYALLGSDLFAFAKAAIVFSVTAILSWATASAMDILPYWRRFISATGSPLARAPSGVGQFAGRTQA
jgi:surface polysaccharide O-acyltransferase-like enzyme